MMVGSIITLIGVMSFGFALIIGKLNSLYKKMGAGVHEHAIELGEERFENEGIREEGIREHVQSTKHAPVDPVGQIVEIDGQELGIINLGESISRSFRVKMNENILTHGEPFGSGGVLGIATLPVIGAGSTVASSLLAGNVFLATANPATLMQIGAGYGSAVMGAKGIIAQAPFISAGSAIIPVVAPVMFFMTVSAMMISARFDRVKLSLDRLMKAVAALLKRELAEDFGLVLSANERLQDITEEFAGSRRFTDEMKIRLALGACAAERSARQS